MGEKDVHPIEKWTAVMNRQTIHLQKEQKQYSTCWIIQHVFIKCLRGRNNEGVKGNTEWRTQTRLQAYERETNKNTGYFQMPVGAVNVTKQGHLTEGHWNWSRAALVRVLWEGLSGVVLCELSPESGQAAAAQLFQEEHSWQGSIRVMP